MSNLRWDISPELRAAWEKEERERRRADWVVRAMIWSGFAGALWLLWWLA